MKNSNNKQRLSLLDLPPPIPAALDTLNLDYVADSYQPGQYELSDLPDKIPIINERTGSFRRFIKRKTPRDRRRIVSAPPGTILEKALPKPPATSRNSFYATPALPLPKASSTPSLPKPRTLRPKPRPFSMAPRSISLINENIPPILTTPGHNPRNSMVIGEDSDLKLQPQQSNLSSDYNSIISDYIMAMDYYSPKDQQDANLDSNSFVDSLFSEDKPANNNRQSISSSEEMGNPIIENPLNLPKTRDKQKVRFTDKPSSYKIKPDSLRYCLDLPQDYNESRFPLVPKNSHFDELESRYQNKVEEKHRSFSDFTHFKVHMINNPSTTADKQEKRRSFSDFTNFKVRSVSVPTLQPSLNRSTTPTTKTNIKSFFNRFKSKDVSKEKSLPPLPCEKSQPRQKKYYFE